MSNLSSDTLFHFTSSLEALQSILKDGIRIGLFAEKLPAGKRAYFVRAISFCNIPLSMISEHVDWYGKFAVGLRRTVLRELGVSPVFYIHSQAKFYSWRSISDDALLANPVLSFFKQYYGKQYHKSSNEYRYKKFYDEKEWRLTYGHPTIEKYSTVAKLDEMRKDMESFVKKEAPLKLTPETIEYIILENPKCFSLFNQFLKSKLNKYREDYLTKILYYSQINKDF